MPRTVTISYKCRCMPAEGHFEILEREAQEDIEDFMSRMQVALHADHQRRSPLCVSEKTEYVKVPTTKEGVVGQDIKGGTQ